MPSLPLKVDDTSLPSKEENSFLCFVHMAFSFKKSPACSSDPSRKLLFLPFESRSLFQFPFYREKKRKRKRRSGINKIFEERKEDE